MRRLLKKPHAPLPHYPLQCGRLMKKPHAPLPHCALQCNRLLKKPHAPLPHYALQCGRLLKKPHAPLPHYALRCSRLLKKPHAPLPVPRGGVVREALCPLPLGLWQCTEGYLLCIATCNVAVYLRSPTAHFPTVPTTPCNAALSGGSLLSTATCMVACVEGSLVPIAPLQCTSVLK